MMGDSSNSRIGLVRFITLSLWLFAGLAATPRASAEPGGEISYNRDVRPILSNSCFTCHGPDEDARKGKLRLDVREAALENRGGYFAIDPGNAEESELVLRIFNEDPEETMPPPDSGKTITDKQRATLKQWVAEGAAYEGHWAYIQPTRPPLPEVARSDWIRNPIDRFILARLEAEGLEPAAEAGPVRLLRRLHFDLVGLPPTAKEAKSFVNGDVDKRYAKAVKNLLRSPHYGERMAMEWLDVVRFADTTGYHSDDYRDMHPYRDYVIAAFNDNMPFDTFTIEQLAGDLFDNPSIQQKIASGYNRLNQITSEGGAQPDEYLAKYMADRVRNLGAVWMGATLGCAECHDHKFDPYSTKDFYSFGAFFADIKEPGKYEHGNKSFAPLLRFPTRKEERLLNKLERQKADVREEPGSAREKAARKEDQKALDAEIKALKMSIASTLITEPVEPREIRVLARGNWMDESGRVVGPATPEFLPPMNGESATPTRMDLARWLVSDHNPMTARAFVNRLWAQFFGRGLAEMLDDFGHQGTWPSHPDLLDWLAVEFQESGWDVKHMVHLIVSSSAYRQASKGHPRSHEADPSNLLLARQTPLRLKAELVRDNALAISGLLDSTVGGPSAKPYQPEGYYDDTYKSVGNPLEYEHDVGIQQYRRGLYTFWKRSFLHPSMLAFDAPSREECTAGRAVSNTPQQALTLMNDPSYVEAARAFAVRMIREGGKAPADRVARAFVLALSRDPQPYESDLLLSLYDKHARDFENDPAAAKEMLSVGLWEAPKDIDATELAAWTSVARAVLNLHEVITRY